MISAGEKMIENDEEHSKNSNILEEFQNELNQAKADYSIALAANGSQARRFEEDRNAAAENHQKAKDTW